MELVVTATETSDSIYYASTQSYSAWHSTTFTSISNVFAQPNWTYSQSFPNLSGFVDEKVQVSQLSFKFDRTVRSAAKSSVVSSRVRNYDPTIELDADSGIDSRQWERERKKKRELVVLFVMRKILSLFFPFLQFSFRASQWYRREEKKRTTTAIPSRMMTCHVFVFSRSLALLVSLPKLCHHFYLTLSFAIYTPLFSSDVALSLSTAFSSDHRRQRSLFHE